jgi:hypothetical protein
MLGLILDRNMLMRERVVQRVAEKLFQIRYRLDAHHSPPIDKRIGA